MGCTALQCHVASYLGDLINLIKPQQKLNTTCNKRPPAAKLTCSTNWSTLKICQSDSFIPSGLAKTTTRVQPNSCIRVLPQLVEGIYLVESLPVALHLVHFHCIANGRG